MQDIIKCITKNHDILPALLKSNYFSWQSKYLESMVYLGDIYSPKKRPWQVRDIILLVKSELTKVQLVAALMKHSNEPGTLKYILNEKELFEISCLLNRSDGDFVKDLFNAAKSYSILEKAQQFVYFLEPSLKSLSDNCIKGTNDFEKTFSQMTNIMESVTGSKIDTQSLKPLLKSVNEFLTNSKGNTITGSASFTVKTDAELMDNVIKNISQYVGSVNKSGPRYDRGFVEEVSEEYGQLAIKY